MVTEREKDVLRAAAMYYLQDMKMEVIARHLHTSRSTVSRLIKRARRMGVVEITLRPTSSRAPGLGRSIGTTFGIATYVVPVPDSAAPVDRLEQVALTSAKLLASWFDSDMVMGIAWGTTLAAVSRHLAYKPTRGSAVVQLNGAANTRTSGIEYASDLISCFGSAFDAAVHYFPVPAFFDFPETKAAMWRERSVRRVLEVQGRADIALFSVGAVAGAIPSHVYAAGYLDDDDVRTLHTEGVVGDVCTVFLRADGSYRDVVLNARATGPTPEELHRVPRRVCVVAGDNKVVPLLAALRSGVVTDLVVDEVTASHLLGFASAQGAAGRHVTRPGVARR
ncbi:MAG TPA: sugar-binding domain-containing protein [Coriobacteriia bacterium]|nr:sugar-binding domain-containing protein [Coriobacteriia bacterium]